MKKKTKWECSECNEQFKTKKDLIEHLKEDLDEAETVVEDIVDYLEDLGCDNPWK